jgi:Thoeris protein ThsB, TIR-like domain
MAKRVFFSFHYRDVVDLRANVVRNHGLTKDDNAGFFDASLWESVKRSGPAALKRLINDGLENTRSLAC